LANTLLAKAKEAGADLLSGSDNGDNELLLKCMVHAALAHGSPSVYAPVGLIGRPFSRHMCCTRLQTSDDANAVDEWGKTALIYACKRDCVETVKYLIKDKSANINYKTCAPLRMHRALISRGATNSFGSRVSCRVVTIFENRTKTGTTSLIIACKNEKPQIAKLLIEHGADVNASNDQRRYPVPLQAAAWVQVLITRWGGAHASRSGPHCGMPLTAA
jgi:ankyrin repeat protein